VSLEKKKKSSDRLELVERRKGGHLGKEVVEEER